jgi:hypothetical protein
VFLVGTVHERLKWLAKRVAVDEMRSSLVLDSTTEHDSIATGQIALLIADEDER